MVAGSLLTVVPPSFGWLLAGRVAQGAGPGLTALMTGAARDHLPEQRSGPTIALLSVASTVGTGVGYPLAGLLTDVSGLWVAYGLGLLITVIALAAAWWAVPQPPPGRSTTVDVPGAALLAVAVVLLTVWVRRERRCGNPLVDLTLLRHPAVAGYGFGVFSAAMPAAILAVTPP
ncbi:MFS transporter [Streptomyces sp. NPDC052101]|uniref:MFS transporter n=1 Tax=Streptomyces sp. NPDC052101 TaxID=3155763 RepID=UPI0034387DE1